MKILETIRRVLAKAWAKIWDSLEPQKSLKSTLRLWFMLFALVPLLAIAAYSTYRFNQRINDELAKRLDAFEHGMDIELTDIEGKLLSGGARHANDYYLINLVRTQKKTVLESVTQSIIENYITDRISFFNPKGKLIVSVSPKRITNDPEAVMPEEISLLPKSLFGILAEKQQTVLKTAHPNIGFSLDCYTQMKLSGKLIGIIKETIVLDRYYSTSIKERAGLDIGILNKNNELLTSSLSPEQEKIFHSPAQHKKITPITLLKESFLMLTKPFVDEDGKTQGYFAILVSQTDTQNTLKEFRNIVIVICGLIMIMVIFFSHVASQTVINPINRLLEAIQNIEKGKQHRTVDVPDMRELATLIHSFNAMSSSLKSTQAQLVHSSKMTSLGQLVAGVAHELNNPIGYTYSNINHLKDYLEKLKNMIQLYEEAVPKLPKPNQTKIQETKKDLNIDFILKDIDSIIQSSLDGTQRTKDIVLSLRNFSRLDEAEIKEVDIHEGLESTLRLLSSEFKNRITLHKDYGTLPKLMCYPSQINQVLMNILSNSIQAIDGPGEIWITTKSDSKNITLSIRDSGKGIEPKHVERIFDPFFTTKKVGQGTGLGLSISYGIIQKHQGDIKVESTLGKGSTFTIILPLSGITKK